MSRPTDLTRGRVVLEDDGTPYRHDPAGADWDDVLIARYVTDGDLRLEVWGKSAEHPTVNPSATHPQFALVAILSGATLEAVPRKGKQRVARLADGTALTVHVFRNCCGSPFRDFRP